MQNFRCSFAPNELNKRGIHDLFEPLPFGELDFKFSSHLENPIETIHMDMAGPGVQG